MATSVDDRVITGYEPKYVFMSELEIDYKHTHIKKHVACSTCKLQHDAAS